MKQAVLLLLVNCMLFVSCGTVKNHVRRKHFTCCPEPEMYRNSDWTKNFYVVDSIPFDSAHYEIVEHIRGGFRFYVPKGYIEKHRRATDYTLLKEKFAIFGAAQGNMHTYTGLKYTDEKTPEYIMRKYPNSEHIKRTHKRLSRYRIWKYDVIATYLRVYMVRGDCYNQVVHSSFEFIWPLRFPDETAYYKVVIPVWSDKPLDPKKLKHSYNCLSQGECRIAIQEKSERAKKE